LNADETESQLVELPKYELIMSILTQLGLEFGIYIIGPVILAPVVL